MAYDAACPATTIWLIAGASESEHEAGDRPTTIDNDWPIMDSLNNGAAIVPTIADIDASGTPRPTSLCTSTRETRLQTMKRATRVWRMWRTTRRDMAHDKESVNLDIPAMQDER